MDPLAAQARECHRKSQEHSRVSRQFREQRDELVRRLWREKRRDWTYPSLARAVGCSPELIAKIITT